RHPGRTAAAPGVGSAGLDAEVGEDRTEGVDGAGHRGVVALGGDRVADELEVENAGVARIEHRAGDARGRDVALAGHEALRRRSRPDLEVAHLYETDAVDAVANRRVEPPFGPARVELYADADVEAAREIDGVLQRVQEADVDAQRVRVLDRERHVAANS